MPVGFQSFLADGSTIQIDSSYKNLHLKSKETIDSATPWASNSVRRIFRVNLGTVVPMVAVRSTAVGIGIRNIKLESGVYYGYFHGPAAGSYTATVYVFDSVRPVASSGAALEIYDAAGNLVFSSLWGPMNVVGVYTNVSPGNLVAEPVGLAYAVLSMVKWQSNEVSGGVLRIGSGGMMVSGGFAQVTDSAIASSPLSAGDSYTEYPGAYAVLDVTNL